MDNKDLSEENSAARSVPEDTELKWSTWESPVVIVIAVVGNDILRWLLGRYTSLSTVSRHVLSLVFVLVFVTVFAWFRKESQRPA